MLTRIAVAACLLFSFVLVDWSEAQTALAVVSVLAYRTISYWLPAVPGAVAYWRLRRTSAADSSST